jgi:S1-C subfamily serine protease
VNYVNLAEYAIKDFNYSKGALIQAAGKSPAVKPDSVAASAGLKESDVIIAVDNTYLDAAHDLGNVLKKYSAGDEVNLIYRRNETENAVKVKLGELK